MAKMSITYLGEKKKKKKHLVLKELLSPLIPARKRLYSKPWSVAIKGTHTEGGRAK